MKVKLIYLKIFFLLLLVACQNLMAADTEPECTNEFLKVQGSPPKTILAGQTVLITLASSQGKKEAEISLTAGRFNKAFVVSGVMKNVGECSISTFMPISLHPIRNIVKNGLALGWHTLPRNGTSANPFFKAGEYFTFSQEYSKDYSGGFNLKIGDWILQKSMPQEKEKVAEEAEKQNEVKNSAPLSDAEKLFVDALENDDLTETNQRLNDSFARAQRESAESESLRNTMHQSIQTLQTLQMQQLLLEQKKQLDKQNALNQQRMLDSQRAQSQQRNYGLGSSSSDTFQTNKSRGCGPPRCGIKD